MKHNDTLHFKNEEGYKKFLAYGHIHNVFTGKKKVEIAGKPHKVDHSKKKS